MRYLLLIIGILMGMLGLLLGLVAGTSIHEIFGAVLMLIGAVFFAGGAIVSAIDQLRAEMRAARQSPPS